MDETEAEKNAAAALEEDRRFSLWLKEQPDVVQCSARADLAVLSLMFEDDSFSALVTNRDAAFRLSALAHHAGFARTASHCYVVYELACARLLGRKHL